MRRAAAVWLILIVLSISGAQSAVRAQGSPVPVEIHRQSDVLVVVINPPEPISLGGLRFQVTRSEVPQTPMFLREYPAFQGIDFYNFDQPACFALRPGDVEYPLPLACQRLDPNRVYVQTLFASDVFWYDRVLQQPRTITVLDDAGTRVSDCPASSFLCEIGFTFAPPADPPAPQAELVGDPADVDNREVLVLISEFEVFSEAAGERVNPQLSWQRQFQDAIDTVNDIQNARVLSIPGVIRSHDEAREISELYQATMVVWGYVDAAAVASNYTITPRWSAIEIITTETATEVFTSTLDEMALYVSRDSDVEYIFNFLIGQLLYFEQNYLSATSFLDAAIEQIPTSRVQELGVSLLYFYRAYAASQQGNHTEALDFYDQALEVDPANAFAYSNRGGIYRGLGDYDQALSDLNQALELAPNLAQAYVNRGNVYSSTGNFEAAISDFDAAAALLPDNAVVFYNRANTYVHLGSFDNALDDYARAIKLNPNFAFAYFNRGNLWFDLGDYDSAIADFTHAIDLDPTDKVALNNRGNAYTNIGEYDRALADYDQALVLDPDYRDAYYNRGSLHYFYRGAYENAIADFTRVIQIDPDFPYAYDFRASAYAALGEFERALDDFTRTIELDTTNVQAIRNRGGINDVLDYHADALADYRRYADLTGEEADPAILARIAELEAQLGE